MTIEQCRLATFQALVGAHTTVGDPESLVAAAIRLADLFYQRTNGGKLIVVSGVFDLPRYFKDRATADAWIRSYHPSGTYNAAGDTYFDGNTCIHIEEVVPG